MSWYVFLVDVFLLPAYRARFLDAPLVQFWSVGASRASLATAILTTAALCLALQGAPFTFGVRLLDHQAPAGDAWETHGSRAAGRGVVWNATMVLGGASTAAAGGLLRGAGAGAGRVAAGLLVAPPHVGVFPLLTLVTGLSMAAAGVVGVAASWRSALVALFLAASAANYGLMYLYCTVVQVGPGAADGADGADLCGGHAQGAGRRGGGKGGGGREGGGGGACGRGRECQRGSVGGAVRGIGGHRWGHGRAPVRTRSVPTSFIHCLKGGGVVQARCGLWTGRSVFVFPTSTTTAVCIARTSVAVGAQPRAQRLSRTRLSLQSRSSLLPPWRCLPNSM